jgi:SAM-dependent methyltransferase
MSFATDHFSALAAKYAEFRPHYPSSLVDALADRCSRHELAWDAGCGSGQLSVALARRFARVIATDPSRAQLDAALRHPTVEYRCEPAEAPTVMGADLVVAAQAAHWFDWPRWLAEVARVTRPGALVALVSYGIQEVAGEVGTAIARYRDAVAPYWPPGRHHVDNHYAELVLPWPAVAIDPIEMVERWTRDELYGYVTTWSATKRRLEATGPDALDRLHAELANAWPGEDRRDVRWPLTVKLARV